MNTIFIKKYIQNLTKNDIQLLASKKNINLNNNELQNIYKYIKNNYLNYFDNKISNETVLNNLKTLVTSQNYNKIYELYNNNKDKI